MFVCKGNICRSPYAERLTRKLLADPSPESLRILSAGIHATAKNPSPKEAVSAARSFGIALDDHEARCLTDELIDESDMIVVMEAGQVRQMEEIFPASRGRCFLLSLFSGERPGWGNYYHQFNIPDPYGKNEDQFVKCYEKINDCVKNMLNRIRPG